MRAQAVPSGATVPKRSTIGSPRGDAAATSRATTARASERASRLSASRSCAARYSASQPTTRSSVPGGASFSTASAPRAPPRANSACSAGGTGSACSPCLREQPAEQRLVHLPRRLLRRAPAAWPPALCDRLLIVVRQRVERAPRQQHAAGQVADAQIGDVARLRRPLERQRRRRQRRRSRRPCPRRRRAPRLSTGSGTTLMPIARELRAAAPRRGSQIHGRSCAQSAIVRTGVAREEHRGPSPPSPRSTKPALRELLRRRSACRRPIT